MKKTDEDKLLAFEMYCYRGILRLSWTQKIRNTEVRERLKVKEDLLQVIMRRQLKLFGHIMRMDDSRKINEIMLGIVEETN